ncbi:arogenate dehydratase/prephenate dehydratase 2, chloroplastic-like [Tasmannia lanceolata]|uniref:arogenate dehydratase/prephenate dehydratase 2, chloroplastic-like n=1 Tax=Tasmannia lanceolata TaxID=3420 RepID=UPI004063A891
MALRVPAACLRSASESNCRSEIRAAARGGGIMMIKMSLKQHKHQHQHQRKKGAGIIFPDLSPPLGTEEEMASSHEKKAVVDRLERLFFKDVDGFLPQLCGPASTPPSGFGFSGRPVRVAYQGVQGSYCQEAATRAFSSVCNAFPCNHMEEAFQALEDKTAERAIIPIENSLDGTIDRNFDLLLRHQGVNIVGELILPVNHCLLAVPGASRSDLKRIVSHPQALSHCKKKLESMDLEIDEVPNAADAARYVSDNRISDTAVIGSKIAATEFGLQVLEQNCQDRTSTGNFNRFLQLGLVESRTIIEKIKKKGWKTTVAFSLEKGVSDLWRALWVMESRNVGVTRVEQRPNWSNPIRESGSFDYVFILDLDGSVSDSRVETALLRLKEITGDGFLRVLGSYQWKIGA